MALSPTALTTVTTSLLADNIILNHRQPYDDRSTRQHTGAVVATQAPAATTAQPIVIIDCGANSDTAQRYTKAAVKPPSVASLLAAANTTTYVKHNSL